MKEKEYISLFLVMFFVVGCASLAEDFKVITGTSTKALEAQKESSGQSRIFKVTYPTVYNQVCNILKNKNITLFLYSQKKHRIVALHFLSGNDTTEVGIFFEEISPAETKVIITSLSPGHLKLATTLIFADLEKINATPKKEAVNASN